MKLYKNDHNAVEIILVNDCTYKQFIHIAQAVEEHLNIRYVEKIGHHDSYYWDFEFNSDFNTIHYQTFCGVRIFAQNYNLITPSTDTEIATLTEIIKILKENKISELF